MACSKYTLTNTGATTVNFSYRRCDDSLWEYQVELTPGQTKNIWTIDGTYTVAPLYANLISLINQGAFPPVNATATPTATPTTTPTITPTPSVTASQTPTPSITSSQTPTTTTTPTPTNTVTPTEPQRYSQSVACHDENSAQGACNCDQGATIFTNGVDFASSTLAWSDSSGVNTGDPVGYYVQNGTVYQVSPGCGIGCGTGSSVNPFGPCGPTPTPSATPTATPSPSLSCPTLSGASSFVVLANSTITNTGNSTITGNLGLAPGTSITGFPPGTLVGTQHINDSSAITALSDASAAYDCLDLLTPAGSVGSDIGGTTITAGTYSVSSSLGITGTVTLDGGGNSNAVFVFQIPTTFIPATNAVVSLTNGTQAGNVYWLVGSSATLSTNSDISGNIIAQSSITFNSGATLTGRAFALTGAVTLDTNDIIGSSCTINPCTV